jgi:protocatechuate 3,4-dioxygenase beta subunit
MAHLLAIFILLAVLPRTPKCNCQIAAESDRPHGANESIEYFGKTVSRIRGRVTNPDGKPAHAAVVEVYEYSSPDNNKTPWEITRYGTRRSACLTDNDGNYCFVGLPSGSYLLRIGTREQAGINDAYVKVRLDRSWERSWLRPGKTVEVRLRLGT